MADKYSPYYEQKETKLYDKLFYEILPELPPFCESFFKELYRGEKKAASSLIGYASDLKIFFTWLKESPDSEYSDLELKDLPIDILEKPSVSDMKDFFYDYLPDYAADNKRIKNTGTTAARKLATLKKFYHHYLNLEEKEKYHITNDPVSAVIQKKDKPGLVKVIDGHQTTRIIDGIEEPDTLFDGKTKEKAWSKKQSKRDIAIITLFATTGIRVSELQGINLQDIDFKENERPRKIVSEDGTVKYEPVPPEIKIHRKGDKEDKIYPNELAISSLKDYIENSRVQDYQPEDGENALFLSRSHGRMSISQIERMVNKYTRALTGMSGYTPHKFRSGFATAAIRQGQDVKKVQTGLGHTDPSTTLRYYAAAASEEDKMDLFRNFKLDN